MEPLQVAVKADASTEAVVAIKHDSDKSRVDLLDAEFLIGVG